jgi:hypothetical protein
MRGSYPSYEVINLGTVDNPKNINLGKSLSLEENNTYLKLFREYQGFFFFWFYQYLKTYDTRIIQHTIPLRLKVKLFEQKPRKFHPYLEHLMHKEMKKLLDANITFQVRHFAWLANLVQVKKK